MEPSIGRVVVYREPLHGLATGAVREHPAFITRVIGPQIVNLMVMWGDERRASSVLSVRKISTFEDPANVMAGWDWPEIKRGEDDATLAEDVQALDTDLAKLEKHMATFAEGARAQIEKLEAEVTAVLSAFDVRLTEMSREVFGLTERMDTQASRVSELETGVADHESRLMDVAPILSAGAPMASDPDAELEAQGEAGGAEPEPEAGETQNDQGPASDPAPTP
jgi:BMFP domain-containing protein YqiC